MTGRPGHPVRGVALVVALVTLVLVVTAAASLLRLATTEHARAIVEDRTRLADDLLRAVDAPIARWLARDAPSVCLPVNATEPAVEVLHDTFLAGDVPVEIRVTAFDECGMVSHAVARSGSPLRILVPEGMRRRLDSVTVERGTPAGLDLYATARERVGGWDTFPAVTGGSPVTFGGSDDPPVDSSDPPRLRRPAFGSVVATHGLNSPGAINVMTAPMPLVEQAMRVAGRGDLDRVLAARAAGRVITLAAAPRRRSRTEGQLRIMTSSSVWAFRIDVRVGSVLRSWWAVYEGAGRGSPAKCVQRLAITT